MQKIKETLHKHKIIYVIVLAIVFYVLYLYLSTRPREIVQNITKPLVKTNLQVLNIDPPSGIQETIWTTQAIAFTFGTPIDFNSLQYTITPMVDTIPFLNPNQKTLYIRPKIGWQLNVNYKLAIKKLSSIDNGQILETEIVYPFELHPAENVFAD